MREKLQNLDWHIYGLSTADFDYIMRITEETIADREIVYNAEAKKVRHESPDLAEDILDDVSYYRYVECSYLWEFCLVRVLGIFEGIIEQKYLPQGQYTSYRNRMDCLKKAGFSYDDIDIKPWLNLRNAIVHSPAEQYSPVSLVKDDLVELVNLLKGKLKNLQKQQHLKKVV